uniref:Uncharacterized protein n=1 Tax=Trichuris muris TaxID=70415 RepID=A0A5S6R5W7_TRIMR
MNLPLISVVTLLAISETCTGLCIPKGKAPTLEEYNEIKDCVVKAHPTKDTLFKQVEEVCAELCGRKRNESKVRRKYSKAYDCCLAQCLLEGASAIERAIELRLSREKSTSSRQRSTAKNE